MSKKLKIVISISLAAILLLAGGTTAVLADKARQTEATEVLVLAATANTTANTTVARVAQILGIPQETLANAIKQAERELRTEALNNYLAKAVEKGRLTQEQANQIKEWWSKRPEALGSVLPRGLRLPARFAPQIALKALIPRVAKILNIPEEKLTSAFQQAQQEKRDQAFKAYLDKAVEKGRITQEKANEIKQWWDQKPAGLGSGLLPRFFHGPGGKRR
ncbi:MAG: hypothetical protein HY665_07855 [Chloroflexi bacterium]|nr:hypothetical protein [Chloroflexota bacterium]